MNINDIRNIDILSSPDIRNIDDPEVVMRWYRSTLFLLYLFLMTTKAHLMNVRPAAPDPETRMMIGP
jgi:hypothetical protein